MAGLIFFWQGGCVEYTPVRPGFPNAGYNPVRPLPIVDFVPVYNFDVSDYVDRAPVAGVSFIPKEGSKTLFAARLPPPSCKHD
jgi:hypothetical protein